MKTICSQVFKKGNCFLLYFTVDVKSIFVYLLILGQITSWVPLMESRPFKGFPSGKQPLLTNCAAADGQSRQPFLCHLWTKQHTVHVREDRPSDQHWRDMKKKMLVIAFRQPTEPHIQRPTNWGETKTILVSVFIDLVIPPYTVGVLFVFPPPKCQAREAFTLLLPIDCTWSLPGK